MAASGRQNDLFADPAAVAKAERAALRERVLKAIVWTHGVALLTPLTAKPENVRSFLGKRVNDLGLDSLARGILSAIIGNGSDTVADPIAYIAALRPAPKQSSFGDGDDGSSSHGHFGDDAPEVNEPFWENDEEAPR